MIGSVGFAVTPPRIDQGAMREPLVLKRMVALGASVELLEKSLVELENRLSPVLAPEVPMPAGGNEKDAVQEICPMADQLQVQTRHIDCMRAGVELLLSRLEV